MYRFTLSLVAFVASIHGGFSASIPTYEVATEEDIRSNLVGYGSDFAEGLTPPLMEAENHFNLQPGKSAPGSENPYVVEIHKNYLSIKTTGFPSEKIKLNQTETEGIQKLSLSFVQLLNSSKLSPEGSENEGPGPEWSQLSPVIILTNSGISLQFLEASDPESTQATEMTPGEKRILWDFLTKYAKNIFEEKLRELKVTEKYAEVFDSPLDKNHNYAFQNFLDFLGSVMRFSVDYAETAFQGWTTSEPDTTTEEVEEERNVRSSTATLFAYEEPSPFHEFPSQEFQFRRKDIDSIFYGRGVI